MLAPRNDIVISSIVVLRERYLLLKGFCFLYVRVLRVQRFPMRLSRVCRDVSLMYRWSNFLFVGDDLAYYYNGGRVLVNCFTSNGLAT